MLGNSLKIDYIVVCFLKPLNSAGFLWEMMDKLANRLDLRPAAELLGGWAGSTCLHKHKCGSSTKRVNIHRRSRYLNFLTEIDNYNNNNE